MRAGLLKDKITIQRATISKNAYGEDVETWSDVYTTRARIIQISSNRTTENSEIIYDMSKEFDMRYYVPIQEYDVIVWNSKKYRVVDILKDRDNVYTKVIGALINE